MVWFGPTEACGVDVKHGVILNMELLLPTYSPRLMYGTTAVLLAVAQQSRRVFWRVLKTMDCEWLLQHRTVLRPGLQRSETTTGHGVGDAATPRSRGCATASS